MLDSYLSNKTNVNFILSQMWDLFSDAKTNDTFDNLKSPPISNNLMTDLQICNATQYAGNHHLRLPCHCSSSYAFPYWIHSFLTGGAVAE